MFIAFVDNADALTVVCKVDPIVWEEGGIRKKEEEKNHKKFILLMLDRSFWMVFSLMLDWCS